MADVDPELKENRFAYLLQPIRDLAANWDIDIAAELGEYLSELDGVSFALEAGGPALNFAEAALLIQGACNAHRRLLRTLQTSNLHRLQMMRPK